MIGLLKKYSVLCSNITSSVSLSLISASSNYRWAGPHGVAVKCSCSAAGGPGSDPGHAPTHHLSDHAMAASHMKLRKMGTDDSTGQVFLSKTKKRRIGMGVSSGLIFLTR